MIFGTSLAPGAANGYNVLSKILHRCCSRFGIGVLVGVALVTLVWFVAL